MLQFPEICSDAVQNTHVSGGTGSQLFDISKEKCKADCLLHCQMYWKVISEHYSLAE